MHPSTYVKKSLHVQLLTQCCEVSSSDCMLDIEGDPSLTSSSFEHPERTQAFKAFRCICAVTTVVTEFWDVTTFYLL